MKQALTEPRGGGLTLSFYTDWPMSFWITALSDIFGAATAQRFAD